ncbi:CHRD domain-containing protein [Paenibacillus harenae]|uniref:CHRD domain-containing protein n=1 Tax=Paenibacillus harenae TaxID=306543 RepID=UPI0027D87B07|nr:CHRD domain-containing protein [Paenibacillus harenae]
MRTYKACLLGRNEVPPVRTRASGTAFFRLNAAGTELRFQLIVRNITRVTDAHIHLGPKGVNGPVVVTLFGPNKFGISVRRGIVRGVLTAADLSGPLAGLTIADLITEFNNGNAYVNVHTVQNPNGEIRGQIKRA